MTEDDVALSSSDLTHSCVGIYIQYVFMQKWVEVNIKSKLAYLLS